MRDRGRIRRQRRERISQGRRITRRETKTDRKQKKTRRETVPAPNRSPYWLQQRENLNPLKDFFSSMRLTQNAPTYQTTARWALCPHITDFPTESKWENSILCFSALSGPTDLFLITGCVRGLRRYRDIGFPFYQNRCTHLVENADTRELGGKAGKWFKK